MTFSKNSWALILLLIIGVSSCSIQKSGYSHNEFKKRKYLRGVHVEKGPDKRKKVSISEDPISENVTASIELDERIIIAPPPPSIDHRTNEVSSASNHKLKDKHRRGKRKKELKQELSSTMIQALAKNKRSNIQEIPNPESGVKVHWGAIAGLVTGIAGILAFPVIGLASVLLLPCAIVFGSIGKRAIRDNPERYKGYGMAQAGFIIGIVGLAALAALMILLILIFSNWPN